MDAPTKVVYIRQSSSIVPTDSSSAYYDTEYSSSNFSTVTYATTNQSSNLMPFQWVKISMKTKRMSGHDVDNTGLTTNQDVPVYYDGAEYLYSPPTINATKTGYRVYHFIVAQVVESPLDRRPLGVGDLGASGDLYGDLHPPRAR